MGTLKFHGLFALLVMVSLSIYYIFTPIKDNGYRKFDVKIIFCDNRHDTVITAYFADVPSPYYIGTMPALFTEDKPSSNGEIWMNVCGWQILKEY